MPRFAHRPYCDPVETLELSPQTVTFSPGDRNVRWAVTDLGSMGVHLVLRMTDDASSRGFASFDGGDGEKLRDQRGQWLTEYRPFGMSLVWERQHGSQLFSRQFGAT